MTPRDSAIPAIRSQGFNMIRKLLVAAIGVAALTACTPAAEDKAENAEGAMAPAADAAMAPAADGAMAPATDAAMAPAEDKMAPAADGAMAADDKMAPAH